MEVLVRCPLPHSHVFHPLKDSCIRSQKPTSKLASWHGFGKTSTFPHPYHGSIIPSYVFLKCYATGLKEEVIHIERDLFMPKCNLTAVTIEKICRDRPPRGHTKGTHPPRAQPQLCSLPWHPTYITLCFSSHLGTPWNPRSSGSSWSTWHSGSPWYQR